MMGYTKWIAVLLCLLGMTACRQDAPRFRIGVAQCSDDSWRHKMNDEILREAMFYDGVSVEIRSAADDNRKQAEDVHYFIDEGVDLLIISANEAAPMTPIVEEAYQKGIPVILVDRKILSDKYTAYIGADNYEIGRAVGNYIASSLKGKGNVVELTGLGGSTPAMERHQGFMAAISNFPDIKLIDKADAAWEREPAEVEMDSMLRRHPKQTDPMELQPVIKQDKMFEAYKEHLTLQRTVGLDNVGDLNLAIEKGRSQDIILVSEAMQEKQVAKIAEKIADGYKEGIRIVLISGPSSSGKTTFCKRLQVQLTTNLLHPVGISLDDYFLNREDTPKDEHGEYDFESLYALDLPYFNKDLKKLLSGEEIDLPTFNFETGQRVFKGKKLKLRENSILVIEGIHALNPELTEFIDDKYKYRVYVSVLTSISLDNHNWIPTTDNRLLRRIIRDYRFRGYSAEDTINRWPSVRRGEDKWIFPYQENADAMFNSAMLYELAALRKYAEPILAQVPESNKANAEAYRLLRFLRYFNYIPTEELPGTSLLREFLGGGSFKY